MQRGRIEPRPMAARTGRQDLTGLAAPRLEPLCFLAALFGLEARNAHPGTKAGRTPALTRVKGQQPRVGLGKAAAAIRTSAPRTEDLQPPRLRQGVRDALTELECLRDRCAQRRFLSWHAGDAGNGQLDVMLDKALEAWKRVSGNEFSVHPQ